jgi:hypothetical protein
MRAVEVSVRELLASAQAALKAKLDVGRVDTVFKVGDRVLLRTKELLDAADIGKLRPRWDGPFTVIACPSPNAYTLDLPRRMQGSPTANVDRLKPFFERSGTLPPPGPVSVAGQEGEHEVEMLLNRRRIRGVTRYLVRWLGHTSADDSWRRVEELGHCLGKVAEYDAVAHRRRAARRGDPAAAAPAPVAHTVAVVATPPLAPAGFRMAARTDIVAGAALVGQAVLYFWPSHGWVRGTVTRRSRAAGFSHVVRYGSASALGAGESTSLLDAASHGPLGRWVLLRRAAR